MPVVKAKFCHFTACLPRIFNGFRDAEWQISTKISHQRWQLAQKTLFGHTKNTHSVTQKSLTKIMWHITYSLLLSHVCTVLPKRFLQWLVSHWKLHLSRFFSCTKKTGRSVFGGHTRGKKIWPPIQCSRRAEKDLSLTLQNSRPKLLIEHPIRFSKRISTQTHLPTWWGHRSTVSKPFYISALTTPNWFLTSPRETEKLDEVCSLVSKLQPDLCVTLVDSGNVFALCMRKISFEFCFTAVLTSKKRVLKEKYWA